MKGGPTLSAARIVLVVFGILAGPGQIHAQTRNTVSPVSGGRPDLQGIWQAVNTAEWNLEPHEGRRREKNIQLLEYECYSFSEGAFELPRGPAN